MMIKTDDLVKGFESGDYDELIEDIYVDTSKTAYHRERFIEAIRKFESLYGKHEVGIYSAPGRSEVGGNHTDHQRGQVLACAVNLDAIGIVSKRGDGLIKVTSDSFNIQAINIANLTRVPVEEGTSESLIRGVAAKLQEEGLLELLEDRIAIGQNHRGKSGRLGIGNCTACFDTCIRGCPATQKDIYAGLRDYILRKTENT